MIPDFEQRMNDKMEQASLKELMPDFDKEQEWQLIDKQLRPARGGGRAPVWRYAAAIALLVLGGAWFLKHNADKKQQETAVHNSGQQNQVTEPAKNEQDNAIQPETATAIDLSVAHQEPPVKNGGSKMSKKETDHGLVINYKAKDYICNNTPCPLQICISQEVQCPNVQPKAVATCSTLEPDQSGQLHYRAHDSIARNCSLKVKEIEITSIATGETILLNETSPTTAQDVFSYITGKKKGDVLAGMFTSDCNHQRKKRGVRLNNKYGDLMIQ